MTHDARNVLSDYIIEDKYRYYYSIFSHKKQNAYNKLLDGYLRHKNSINITVDCIDDAWTIHRAICYDYPEVFFIKSIKGNYNSLLSTATIYPEYRFDYDTCINILLQMERRTEVFIRRISMLSELEKAKQIHDYIIRNVTYKDLEAPYSHESPGVLLYGIAVCEGISKAFKYLSDRVGIMSIVVIGNSIESENQLTDTTGHAWNIVYINSVPYHLDVTFDYSLSSKNIVRYDYFLLSDSQIQIDHLYEEFPTCINCFEFYKTNGHFVEDKKALETLVNDELRYGRPLVVKTPNFSDEPRYVSEKLLDTVASILSNSFCMQFSVSVSYNKSRMIFQFELLS